MLEGEPSSLVFYVWDIVAPMIQKAIDKGPGDENLEDVREQIDSRDAQLWVYRVDGEIKAACVTKIIQRPRRKIATMPYLGGEGLKAIISMQDELKNWAREQGCSHLEGYARKGWLRVLPEWKQVFTTIRTEV